ncbi:Shedu anti-phage system protein SduA domain-containing protein [Acinetobacter venetianus]|uniref:Shedu anti-phage system protein SduA domain-containing protein n=1 Tax=Acinetobacter venetianus TaxID=52133 RepID=UPI0028974FBB|nr:Shedu anti-phage system protein SduA domain-containing protein [Acinetobacter venetianus]
MSHVPWAQVDTCQIYNQIKDEWLNLLANKKAKELDYQLFLQQHAGFFFPSSWDNEEIIVSELVLGSEYRADFMIASSQRSYGFVYTLIEIEVPHEPAFTKNGQPRARLTHALQQIRDWKRWIENNRDQANRIFPSKRNTVTGVQHFEYIVVIGRRTDATSDFDDKRNQLAKDLGVQIRSFDWFTDNFLKKRFSSFNCYSSDLIGPTKDQDNDLSNPFYYAYSSKNWHDFINSPQLKLSHMIGHNIASLLSLRTLNLERLNQFKIELKSLPLDRQKPSETEYERLRMRTSVL